DGVLLAGQLAAGVAPATTLKPMLDNLLNGPEPINPVEGFLSYGFTPDGDHAWALTGLGGVIDNNSGCLANGRGCLGGSGRTPYEISLPPGLMVGFLESVDLSTGARVNWGGTTFQRDIVPNGPSLPAPCFLANGQVALSPHITAAQHYESI